MSNIREKLKIIEQLRPFTENEEVYGRIHADFHDLLEASEWFLAEMGRKRDEPLSPEQVEDFLLGVDVNFIQHTTFHLTSLQKELGKILDKLGEEGRDK